MKTTLESALCKEVRYFFTFFVTCWVTDNDGLEFSALLLLTHLHADDISVSNALRYINTLEAVSFILHKCYA